MPSNPPMQPTRLHYSDRRSRGLPQTVSSSGRHLVEGRHAGDAAAQRATIDEIHVDVVLTDIRMPPSGTDEGIRIAEELRTSHPDIGVVVLSQDQRRHIAPASFSFATSSATDATLAPARRDAG